MSEDELLQLHGMGRNALSKLREVLKVKDLAFAKAGKTLKDKKENS